MNSKLTFLLLLLAAAWPCRSLAAVKHTIYDLAGNWESTVDVGKFKIRLIVKLEKSAEGKMTAGIDVPDQGAKNIPVSALLCNYPAVRLEVDPFQTSFNGTVNEAGDVITGAFEEGPGGRPMAATFRRLSAAALTEPNRVYTFQEGEARDIRGYWTSKIDAPPGPPSRVGLRIGRAPDGSFKVLMDMLDRGMSDVTASSVTSTNAGFKFEWQLLQVVFEGKLDDQGNKLSGQWRQNGRPTQVAFERLAQPATALPANLSFTPDKPEDIRGEWKGTLEVPGNKLRLVIKVGRTPEGSISGTLASLDQGGGEIPMSSGSMTNLTVKLEWESIHGVYKGTLNNEGTALDGSWEQMGPGLPLKLERAPVTAKAP